MLPETTMSDATPNPTAPEKQQGEKLMPPTPTPLAYKQDVAELSETPTDRHSRVVQAFAPRVVGPMPVKRFIRRYFKLPDAPPLTPQVYFLWPHSG